MAHHVGGQDAVAGADFGDQRVHRVHLRGGEGDIAELVAGVDDLDADAGAVHVRHAAPPAAAGVPGALGFINHLEHRTVFGDDIMGGNAGLRVGQPVDGFGAALHAGVVQYRHANGQLPVVEIGAGALNHVGSTGMSLSRRCAVRMVMMATPTSVKSPPTIIWPVIGVSYTATAMATEISGVGRVSGETTATG